MCLNFSEQPWLEQTMRSLQCRTYLSSQQSCQGLMVPVSRQGRHQDTEVFFSWEVIQPCGRISQFIHTFYTLHFDCGLKVIIAVDQDVSCFPSLYLFKTVDTGCFRRLTERRVGWPNCLFCFCLPCLLWANILSQLKIMFPFTPWRSCRVWPNA